MNEITLMSQAKQLATNTLKHHAKLLGHNEPAVLNNFLNKLSSNTQRKKLTARDCQKIINIAEAVNKKYMKNIRSSSSRSRAQGVRYDA